jgi:hypothetical protein
MTVFLTNEDEETAKRMQEFLQLPMPPHVQVRGWPLIRRQLLRRVIGRNLAAASSDGDWIWFSDCDFAFGPSCLDSLPMLSRMYAAHWRSRELFIPAPRRRWGTLPLNASSDSLSFLFPQPTSAQYACGKRAEESRSSEDGLPGNKITCRTPNGSALCAAPSSHDVSRTSPFAESWGRVATQFKSQISTEYGTVSEVDRDAIFDCSELFCSSPHVTPVSDGTDMKNVCRCTELITMTAIDALRTRRLHWLSTLWSCLTCTSLAGQAVNDPGNGTSVPNSRNPSVVTCRDLLTAGFFSKFSIL